MEPLCVANGNMKSYIVLVQNSVAIPQNIKPRITVGSRDSTSEYIPKRIKSKNSNRYLYTHVCSSSIHNYQKVEINQLSTDR